MRAEGAAVGRRKREKLKGKEKGIRRAEWKKEEREKRRCKGLVGWIGLDWFGMVWLVVSCGWRGLGLWGGADGWGGSLVMGGQVVGGGGAGGAA